MNRNSRHQMYESLYYHDLNLRESFTARVQWTSALIFSVLTVIAYMARTLDTTTSFKLAFVFYFSIGLAFFLIINSIVHLKNAVWGNTYQMIPTPIEIDRYRDKLITYNKEIHEYNIAYPNNKQPIKKVDLELNNFIYGTLRDCSSLNSEINRKRSSCIYDSMKWFMWSTIPLLLACLVFILYDLDASSPRKDLSIYDHSNDRLYNYWTNEFSTAISENNSRIIDILEKIAVQKELIMSDTQDQTPPPPSEPTPPETRTLSRR